MEALGWQDQSPPVAGLGARQSCHSDAQVMGPQIRPQNRKRRDDLSTHPTHAPICDAMTVASNECTASQIFMLCSFLCNHQNRLDYPRPASIALRTPDTFGLAHVGAALKQRGRRMTRGTRWTKVRTTKQDQRTVYGRRPAPERWQRPHLPSLDLCPVPILKPWTARGSCDFGARSMAPLPQKA